MIRTACSRTSLLLGVTLALSGCASTAELAAPIEFPQEPVRTERRARQPIPEGEILVSVDRLKADLERAAPFGWTLEDPVDQIESPDGWTRDEGGRGLSFTFVGPRREGSSSRFTVTLIPRGWEGRNIPSGTAIRADALVTLEKAHPGAPQVADPARFLGTNAEWLAFHTTLGHDGWEHPAEDVAHALQVSPRS